MKFDFRRAAIVSVGPVLFAVGFAQLAEKFNYPSVLRSPAAEVLEAFAKSQAAILPWWWAMFAAALSFIPISILVPKWLGQRDEGLLMVSVVGVSAAIFQALGLSRWVFAVPVLAGSPEDPTFIKLFELLNQWFGVGLGEWSGYLFTASWTILVCLHLLKSSRWLGFTGIFVSLGVACGLLEVFGFPWAGTVNAISYSLWVLWMIALAIHIARYDQTQTNLTS